MNIIFCHDGPVNCDENNRFSSIGFNDKLFPRYERIFGKIDFITRIERSKNEYSEADKLSIDRFRVIEYPNYLTIKGLFANKSASNQVLEDEIRKCDGLIIRLPSFLGNRCVKIARKFNKPYLIELVGCPWDALRTHGLSGKVLAPYMYLRTRLIVKKASHVLYVTNEFLQNRYPTHGYSVGCSDVELQNGNDNVVSKRKKTDPKNIVIGTVGKIDLRYKGHATVIEAIKLLKKDGYQVQYQIVGPGDNTYLKTIAQQNGVEEDVLFTGSMGHDDIFTWLNNIDLYIQPSLTEGMPRALIEAMSKGCPCIASNAGGMPELLDNAFIFKKGSSKQLVSIIENAEANGLYNQCKRNIQFTNKFLPDVVKETRNQFYEAFRSSVEEMI